MADVRTGRYTAFVDQNEVVVFLIGMRINAPARLHKWLPVAAAMPRMLRELEQQRDLGLLGWHAWFGRTIIVLQYWESYAKLDAYARAADHAHLPAWRTFNRRVGASGEVGIWHETYVVPPRKLETIYGNMPPFGLAAATAAVPVGRGRRSARDRLGLPDEMPPEVPAY
jgi:hypothetical protein